MTVEMIDKMDFTKQEWIEILGVCEMLFNGLCELYCQKKRPEQQCAAKGLPRLTKRKFFVIIYVGCGKQCISIPSLPPSLACCILAKKF